ncbi:lytic transglycosylase domain-containing protein [Novosphingobium sp. BL-8H]|uniref:lytic transglycosylase domain-containing protein n=1 Tax=Novosphingobium sp. BL-8H TaxID=3127640 RepID=UPI0037576531
MGALRATIAVAAIFAASPAHASEVERWQSFIDEASARFGVPSAWIRKVMWAESRGRTEIDGRPIRSAKGAIGLMQLMPGTWGEMRARLSLGSDPDDPRDNILAGTFYLRTLYDRFGYPGLFAAYNAGPARYEKYLSGTALPSETVAYLAAMSGSDSPAREAPSPLFVTQPQAVQTPVENPANKLVQTGGEAVNEGGKTAPREAMRDPLFAVRKDPR